MEKPKLHYLADSNTKQCNNDLGSKVEFDI